MACKFLFHNIGKRETINKEEMIMKRMKILLLVLCTAIMLLGLTLSASASTITITPSTTLAWYGDNNNEPSAEVIASKIGYIYTLELLYKQDQGKEPSDEGSYAASYDTSFANTPNDPMDATIKYVPTSPLGSIDNKYEALFLLVKDGKHDPCWYIFDLLHVVINPQPVVYDVWDRMEDIVITGFWPAQGAISNVAIFGGTEPYNPPPGPEPTPEPATLLLLGLGLVGLAGTRRNFKG